MCSSENPTNDNHKCKVRRSSDYTKSETCYLLSLSLFGRYLISLDWLRQLCDMGLWKNKSTKCDAEKKRRSGSQSHTMWKQYSGRQHFAFRLHMCQISSFFGLLLLQNPCLTSPKSCCRKRMVLSNFKVQIINVFANIYVHGKLRDSTQPWVTSLKERWIFNIFFQEY